MNGSDPLTEFFHLLNEMLRFFWQNPWWGLILITMFGSSIGGAVRAWMKHRRYIAKLKYENTKNAAATGEIEKLRQRCEDLEKRCAALEQTGASSAALSARCDKLEEHVLSAHLQLADERRELDTKLTTLLDRRDKTVM